MAHHHDHHATADSHDSTDHGLLRRIRSISWANGAIGAVELVGGVLAGSSTLTMAGVHDASDGMLYNMKHKAACEKDHARKLKLRKRGAAALIVTACGIGGYEIADQLINDDHHPDKTAAVIALGAAAANIGAAAALHGKKHHHDAHDSWKHVIGVDVPGSIITLVVTPLSVKYPGLDMVGAAAHTALASHVGVSTLRAIKRDEQPTANDNLSL